jgi:hypothetical protein
MGWQMTKDSTSLEVSCEQHIASLDEHGQERLSYVIGIDLIIRQEKLLRSLCRHENSPWCKMSTRERYMTPREVRSLKEQIIIVQPALRQAFLINAGTSGNSNTVEMIVERVPCGWFR